MNRLIPLLKYLDRKKITPEAVVEIAAALNRSVPLETAAEVANAFRTRGMAGLVPMLPSLLTAPEAAHPDSDYPRQIPYQCSKCGEIGLINLTAEQFATL